MNNLYENNFNIIEELYYGNIQPDVKCVLRGTQYDKCSTIISDSEDKLNAYFKNNPNTEEEHRLFSQLMDMQSDILCFQSKNYFIEGFQLGARLILDTFVTPQKSVLRDIV